MRRHLAKDACDASGKLPDFPGQGAVFSGNYCVHADQIREFF